MTDDPWEGMSRDQAWARYRAEEDRQQAWRDYYARQGLEMQRAQVESSRSNMNLIVLLLCFVIPAVVIVIIWVIIPLVAR